MDNYLGEIRAFGFPFAPRGWALCDGALIVLSQNTALFSLLGTTYGGDGRYNFALPDLQGSAIVGPGQGPGLSSYVQGDQGGAPTVTLNAAQMGQHTHTLTAAGGQATLASPGAQQPSLARGVRFYNTVQTTTTLDPINAVSLTGGGQAHNNLMPSLALSFCIALQGIYPPRGAFNAEHVLAVATPGGEIVPLPAGEQGSALVDATHVVMGTDEPEQA